MIKLTHQHFKLRKYYAKEILGFIFILFAIFFFRHQKHELLQLGVILRSSNTLMVIMGTILTIVYCLCHAIMYRYSFKTVDASISMGKGLKLFLKRNFVSVFLPGGGVTSLAFFSGEIEKSGVSRTRISLASYIYGLVGIFTVFMVTIPVMIYLLLTKQQLNGDLFAFGALSLTIILLVGLSISLIRKGWAYRKLIRFRPDTELILEEIAASNFSSVALIKTISISLIIEFVGIAHLVIAIKALGISGHLDAAVVGYVIATLFLVISPFLKGLGAVELSLVLVLKRYGLDTTQAAAITFLYRLFEFWLPLFFGALSFILNKRNIVLRIWPALMLLALGIVDIISVLTPALKGRLEILANFLPVEALRLSNGLVLLIGILQLITAAFLLKGMRSAWNIAVLLCILAIGGNMIKGLDYEEATLALTVLAVLLLTRKQYYVKANRNLQNFSLGIALTIFAAVTIYGIVGFYFLDKRHFGIDFSLENAIRSTFDNFILLNYGGLVAKTHFASLFLNSIRLLGAGSILLIVYGSIKPYLFENRVEEEELEEAKQLLGKYGRSAVDYFKTYNDKLFFFPENRDGFIAYRASGDFAIALEGPVCADQEDIKLGILREFEQFCFQNGLKAAYYRVDGKEIGLYEKLGRKNIIIGQEAIVDLASFSLEGGARKSLRNALSSIQKKGFVIKTYSPPVKSGILQKVRQVSDDWLISFEREEMVFSQGRFDENELKNQPLLSLENEDEKIVAFLNIIPDYVPGELTYDLIRKTTDAPGGNMDALIVELIAYGKANGYKSLNMGMAPLSGIDKGRDLPEQAVKFAYEKLRMFSHYHGLRDFKQKFSPVWEDRFLVYDTHFDLLRLPSVLNAVMKAD
ncbi:phosphatidylglycerol lysyltransferase domain-containing protein [Pedobacter terrae]|uniref:phosphatidylglycerol lysyltransferase domain-containing protein n=1 Tax=Pedobacter terrae TaxID=405671 RepID=UPI002FF5F0FB